MLDFVVNFLQANGLADPWFALTALGDGNPATEETPIWFTIP